MVSSKPSGARDPSPMVQTSVLSQEKLQVSQGRLGAYSNMDLLKFLFTYYCVCVCVSTNVRVLVWMSEDSFMESIVSFYFYMSFGIEIRSLGLNSRCESPGPPVDHNPELMRSRSNHCST